MHGHGQDDLRFLSPSPHFPFECSGMASVVLFFGLFGSGLFFGLFGSGFLVAGAIVLRLYFICLC